MKQLNGEKKKIAATAFQKRVFLATKKIPKGRVATYKEIAAVLGEPRAARAVGNALNKNRSEDVPCHRIIRSDGSVGGYAHGRKRKEEVLKKEGIAIRKGKINLSRYGA